MIIPISISRFFSWFTLDEKEASFSHPVQIGTLDGIAGSWFCKHVTEDCTQSAARYEQLANEIFRLIKPETQPKTIIATNRRGKFSILTESIPGYVPLPDKRGYALDVMPANYELRKNTFYVNINNDSVNNSRYSLHYAVFNPQEQLILSEISATELKKLGITLEEQHTEDDIIRLVRPQFSNILNLTTQKGHTKSHKDTFTNGTHSGLGDILVTSLWLDENDLKNQNIGLNSQGHVVKIDGGCCFSSYFDPEDFIDEPHNLTPELIENLPLLTNYHAYNWLNFEQNGARHSTSDLIDFNLIKSKPFRAEVNQALLKIILIPHDYLRALVQTFLNNRMEQEDLFSFLCARRDQLRHCALRNHSFGVYLSTPAAQQDAQNHLEQMKAFQTQNETMIVHASEHIKLEDNVKKRWDSLCSQCEESALRSSPISVDSNILSGGGVFINHSPNGIASFAPSPVENTREHAFSPINMIGFFRNTFSRENLSGFFSYHRNAKVMATNDEEVVNVSHTMSIR